MTNWLKGEAMKFRIVNSFACLCLITALAVPMTIHGQLEKQRHHHYRLFDLTTFGGPVSYIDEGSDMGWFSNAIGNNQGSFTGWADRSTPAVMATAVASLAVASLLAGMIPARKAAATDPAQTLRME
jgi:hypothetical protein